MWYIKSTPPWYVDRDVSIRNSLRSNYDTSTRCTYSSLEPLGSTCSRARYQQRELLSTWYDLVRYMQAPNRLGDVGEAQHTWYIRPGRHAHEPGTSSELLLQRERGLNRNTTCTRYIRGSKCGSSSFIFTHLPEAEKRKKKKA